MRAAGFRRADHPRRVQATVPQGRIIIAAGLLIGFVLAFPRQTVTTKYVNDLFIFLDGAYRIQAGQVPNVDFHSSLGPLAYYIPAMGHSLGGSFAAAMPVGMALMTVGVALVAAHVIATRMRPALGLPLALYLLLIVAVPMNPGEGIRDLSFAMFYNRIGWSALGLLLVMYLPPCRPGCGQGAADAVCAALLLLLMLYLKISYGLVGLAFLIFMLSDRRQWQWAAAALALTAAAGLLVERLWGGTASHIADLRLAGEVSGDFPTLRALVGEVQRNLPDIAVYGIFAALLLSRRRSIRDGLFLICCALAGILLIEQNFQAVGILTLGAGAAVAAESSLRAAPVPQSGVPLLLAAFLAPPILLFAAALGLHSGLGLARQGTDLSLPNYSGIRLVRLWAEGQHPTFRRYDDSLRDGAALLARLDDPGRVMVLDFVNPFSVGMGLVPPRGDSTWHHWGRTIDAHHHPAPDAFFADARIVMDPKVPIEPWTTNGLRKIYGAALAERYSLAAETEFWRLYLAKDADRTLSRPGSITTTMQSTTAQP
ncbi:hypothetical protein [Paracoccus benzoatiresistens]|uniref:Uncharacterized protein n=1 Tax=Paracoccus benzoatiresistens TaxID=2997341 RepID=A0ABT4J9J1_9RHOB|nr:hypothetical protein [Paracoccus sp. EF6]MCZ0963751.1 hypothetical protein [Paracoccus sp. EF6]